MKKMKKVLVLIAALMLLPAAAGCSRTTLNKEAKDGLNAFNSIVKAFPDKKGFHKELSHWGFQLPTGEKFEWTKDMSANKADFAMVMLADPFIKAGMDVNKLDVDQWLFKPAGKDEGKDLPNLLVKFYNVGDKKVNSNGSEDAFRRLLQADPGMIKYHAEQQHYRLILGEGYEVQWTEKLGLNDADIIFTINADPLVEAGLDISKLEGTGWIFKPAGQDPSGMGENPDQLVKIYKLK